MNEKLYIDTHTHYCDKQFNSDRAELMKELEQKFHAIVEIGCDIKTSQDALALADKYDFVKAAIGIHPSDVKAANLSDIDWIKQNAKNKNVVAIGEIGLDYYWDKDKEIQDRQKRTFIVQMDIARQNKLPIVVHSREASKDTLDMIKEYASDLSGIIHCYSYSYETAKEYIKMGYFLGIGGVVTYENAPKLHEVVSKIPIDFLVLETDCPYLPPASKKRTRNSSLNLPEVVEQIAKLKNISVDAVLQATHTNAKKVYNIK